MTLLFISKEGFNLGLAMRCASEGYSIIFYTEDEAAAFVGNGIVSKPNFSKHLLNRNEECISSNVNQLLSETKPDLVVIDSSSLGKVADYVREQNISVFGSSHWSDTLSTSLTYTSNIFQRLGISKWEREAGTRVECGIFWNGMQTVASFQGWNEERFLTGSLGQQVESAGNVVQFLPFTSRLYIEGIGKLERLLKKTKFRGLLTLSCIVTKSKLYGISLSSLPTFLPALLETYKGSVTDLLLSVSMGRKYEGQFTTDYALSILLSIPPYPTATLTNSGSAIRGVSPSNLRHLYLMDIKKEGDVYESAGTSGSLCYVTARGRDVQEAKKRAYKTISNLEVEDGQYRIDVGERASRVSNFNY